MPKQTDTKTTRRPPADLFIWKLFVEACGDCCRNPTCKEPTGVPLVRGHIHRHADGGFDDLRNLMPLCRPCNSQFNQEYTMGDHRPNGWQSRFLKLLCGYFGVAPTSYTRGPQNGDLVSEVPGSNPTQTKQIIPWDRLEFEPQSELYTDPTPTRSKTQPFAATGVAEELVREGMDHRDYPINPPPEKLYDALRRKASELGRERFLLAGRYFLRRSSWVDDHGRVTDRTPWATFHGGILDFLKKAIDQKERDDKQAAIEREASIKYNTERLERERNERWRIYCHARDLNWSTMTTADREFVAGMKQGDTVQDVTVEEMSTAANIRSRYWEYTRTTEKHRFQETLKNIGQRFFKGDYPLAKETQDVIESLRKRVEAAYWDAPMGDFKNELAIALKSKEQEAAWKKYAAKNWKDDEDEVVTSDGVDEWDDSVEF